MYNLNLPTTQMHSFHLLDEQRLRWSYKKFVNNTVTYPFLLSFFLGWTCFFFVNFMWGDLVFHEILNRGAICLCPMRDQLFGYRNFMVYFTFSAWIIFS